jgi:hypothetical protein
MVLPARGCLRAHNRSPAHKQTPRGLGHEQGNVGDTVPLDGVIPGNDKSAGPLIDRSRQPAIPMAALHPSRDRVSRMKPNPTQTE